VRSPEGTLAMCNVWNASYDLLHTSYEKRQQTIPGGSALLLSRTRLWKLTSITLPGNLLKTKVASADGYEEC